MKARILTIGTELTSGEVVNSNAAWMSAQLEDKGLRVYSHLTVRDEFTEIAVALAGVGDAQVLIVSGGLGPTSDDITREALARFAGVPLEFDEQVWSDMQSLYQQRGLRLLEAHKHQCHFPAGAERLKNSAGTALGFAMTVGDGKAQQNIFVVPGPPAEMQRVWAEEVAPRLQSIIPASSYEWKRWVTLGVPESEVALYVEEVLNGNTTAGEAAIEVGYRASYPYVRVKAFLDGLKPAHRKVEAEITRVLQAGLVGRGTVDLAEELLKEWPAPELVVADELSEYYLFNRLLTARKALMAQGHSTPHLKTGGSTHEAGAILKLSQDGEGYKVSFTGTGRSESEVTALPFKVPVTSERGRRGAAERSLWTVLKWLRVP